MFKMETYWCLLRMKWNKEGKKFLHKRTLFRVLMTQSIPGGGGCFDSGPGFCLEAIAHAPTNRLSNF